MTENFEVQAPTVEQISSANKAEVDPRETPVFFQDKGQQSAEAWKGSGYWVGIEKTFAARGYPVLAIGVAGDGQVDVVFDPRRVEILACARGGVKSLMEEAHKRGGGYTVIKSDEGGAVIAVNKREV